MQFLQWRAWARWLLRDYKTCTEDCDRGLQFSPRSVPLLRLRGDALVELQLYRRALQDYDVIVQLYTESGDEIDLQIQDVLQLKHKVADRFLAQADELTEKVLRGIEGKEHGPQPPQQDQMGLFHGMLLREGQFTGCLLYTSPSPRDS